MGYRLFKKDSGEQIATISEEQLAALTELLEEEAEGDHDYYVDRDVLEFLETEGVDPALLDLIRPHVGEEEGVEVEWRRD